MGAIITITNQKGGTGKSTISINLAAALSHNGHSVFVVDADPQGTISRWAVARKKQKGSSINTQIAITENPYKSEDLLKLKQQSNYDFIIIDCGPANSQLVKAALIVSTVAIIPISPSPLDIDSARSTIELIKHGTGRGAIKVKPYLLISKKIVGTNLANDARDAIHILDVPILKTEISQRIALCESAITGQSVIEYAPHSLATQEFISLSKEVKKCLK